MKINLRLFPVWLVAVFAAIGIVNLVYAGAVLPLNRNVKDRGAGLKLGFPPPFNWVTEQWTGTDKPYIEAKVAIDTLYKNKRLDRATLIRYQEQSQKNPLDTVAQYRWGYAFETALNNGVFFETTLQELETSLEISWGMQKAPSPHSYEYTRLLFLISARRSMYKLIPLARRLLLHTPNDYDVEFYLNRGLASATTPQGKEEALANAQELIKKYPNQGGPYGALAEVYSARWEKGDIQAGPLAVAAYQKYLSMPPKGLTLQDREGLKYWINFIQTHPEGPKGPKSK